MGMVKECVTPHEYSCALLFDHSDCWWVALCTAKDEAKKREDDSQPASHQPRDLCRMFVCVLCICSWSGCCCPCVFVPSLAWFLPVFFNRQEIVRATVLSLFHGCTDTPGIQTVLSKRSTVPLFQNFHLSHRGIQRRRRNESINQCKAIDLGWS